MNELLLSRRACFRLGAAALASTICLNRATAQEMRTRFQIACMTLPYSQYPLARALKGIAGAGYKYVAWGTTHKEGGEKATPVMPEDAPPAKAAELGKHCRDVGLEPLMMFSTVYPEHPKAIEVFKSRIEQAQAAKLPQILTFGHSQKHRSLWIERLKSLGPIARDHGVLIVVKQHGETGQEIGDIVREVNDPGIRVNYDAGNVMDYTKGKVDPLDDIKTFVELIDSFCIKDHRLFPVDQDCGPGFGEIDHYRLLANVAAAGKTIPLCCENISVPRISAKTAEDIDANARRAREFLELVIQGLLP